ncbi:MAG: hypothetical protein HRT38_17890 [Alteromonadaceae bacterium]|nr:hypothetical protein [Alteromonadaceae bacterium]
MNYSEVIDALNNATGFDLFRIKTAIERMLDDPKRILELKQNLTIGQEIQYFEPDENRNIKASVTKFNRTRVSVKNIPDGAIWTIPYYFININEIDTNISNTNKKAGLGRNEVKVKDKVGFIDRNNVERYGEIVRLNQQTVTLNCSGDKWRVHYSFLFKVINPDIDALPG